MRAWGKTDKGIVRSNNQDTFAIELDAERRLALLVVCDGMGGAKSGDVASNIASATFTAEVWSRIDADDVDEAASMAVSAANEAVNRHAEQNPGCFGMGTTLVSAMVNGGHVVIINVGDSRAYHLSEGGITRLTVDHSVVEDMLLAGDITSEEARSHPSKNLITRAIGGDRTVVGDLYEYRFNPGEYLLLCSDGLSNMLEDDEIAQQVLEDIDSAADRLIDAANERGGRDNITVVLLEL